MASSAPLPLEQWISKRLCMYGGSLTLDALQVAMANDSMVQMSPTSLQRFLNESPHKMFRLDKDNKRNECTVRIKTDAVLCDQYNPKNDSCQGCEDFHLCRHFVSGGCERGTKCFWPHQLWGVPQNEKVLILNGLDHLEDSHVMQILKQSWPDITVPTFCTFYNTKGCDNKKCKFLHICRHYITGDCKFNAKCRYSHDVKDKQPMTVWEKYVTNAASMSPGELLRMVREKNKIENVEVVEKQTHLPDTCTHYNKKSCKNGDECPFLHVCSFFVRGQCKFGDKCKRSHDVKNSNAMQAWKKYEVDARNKTEEELVSLIQGHKEMDGENKIQRRRHSSFEEALEGKQDKNEICEYKLRGKCHFDEGCRKVHCEQNFQWQYSDDGQSWTSWEADVNVAVETVFCDITRTNTGSKMSCINFKTMKWTYSKGTRSVRRLETPVLKSLDSLSWQKALSTDWQWYYLDNESVWVLSEQNSAIERAYQSYLSTGENKRFKFETSSFKYSLNFTSMRQTNLISATKREARRRPAKLITKDMLEKCLKQIKVLATILPPSWDTHNMHPTDPSDNFVLCMVQPDIHKAEYDKVLEHFAATMDKRLIIKIERIQNTEVWDEFVRKRDKMKENHADNKDVKEELLFHGTRKAYIKAICQQNFDTRLSGISVGTKYGQGCYFSKTSVYSDCYAEETEKGTKQMFLVRVLVGSYILGHPSYRRPPLKNASNLSGPMFDSCVDNVTNPNIFVTFDSRQVYPEYMITYKKK